MAESKALCKTRKEDRRREVAEGGGPWDSLPTKCIGGPGDAQALTDPERLPGKQVNEFVPDEYIAGGATGLACTAAGARMELPTALKPVSRSVGLAPIMAEAGKRLEHKARAAGRLSHPNMATVHGWGETGEFFYICIRIMPTRLRNSSKRQ